MKLAQNGTAGTSSLYSFCGGLREACWLAAAVSIPLLFSPQALSGFDPFRTGFLQLLAIITLTAGVLRAFESNADLKAFAKRTAAPLPRTTVAFFGVFAVAQLVSTLFSIHPWQSFWGSYEFRQGSCTILSYLVIAVSVVIGGCTDTQQNRLITALILPAVPLSLYALLQRAGLDPLFGFGQAGQRVTSLAGSPLYLAGHLGFTFIFTLWRIRERLRREDRETNSHPVDLIVYGSIGALQIFAIILTQSRAATIALVAAVFFFTFTQIALSSRRGLRLMLLSTATGAALLALFIALTYSSPTLLTKWPLAARITGTFSGDNSWITRVDLWQTAVNIATASDAVILPTGTPDRWHAIRPLIGYGPEMVPNILPSFWPFTKIYWTSWTHFHAVFWDQWINWGALGSLTYLGMIELAFLAGFRRLGLITTRSDYGLYLGLIVLGSGGICGLLVTRFGLPFMGLGITAGFAGTKILYVLLKQLGRSAAALRTLNRQEALILAALAGLFFHVIETSFLFAVPATALLFWICLALTFSPMENPGAEITTASPTKTNGSRPADKWFDPAQLIGPGLVTLLMGCLLFAFLRLPSLEVTTTKEVLIDSLLKLHSGGSSHLIILFLIPVWLTGSFMVARNTRPQSAAGGWQRAFFSTLCLSGFAAIVYAFVKAGQLAAIPRDLIISTQPQATLAPNPGYEPLSLFFLSAFGAVVTGLGWSCSPHALGEGRRALTGIERGTAFACVGLSGLCIWVGCVTPLRADVHAGWAKDLVAFTQPRGAINAYHEALRLDPHPMLYRANEAALLITAANSATDPAKFEDDMSEAEKVLTAGRSYSKFDKGTFLLGELYSRWASAENLPARRTELAKQANCLYEETMRFDRKIEAAIVESALLNEVLLNNATLAAAQLKRADDLSPTPSRYDGAKPFFDYYAGKSFETRNPDYKRLYANRALRYYLREVEAAAKYPHPMYALNVSQGMLQFGQGNLPLALEAFKRAAEEGDRVEGWRAEGMLAQCYSALGNKTAALHHVNQAIAIAPKSLQRILEQMRQQIELAQ